MQLYSLEVSRGEDIARAFAHRSQLVSFAEKGRMPSMYGQKEFADVGGLISYGPNTRELWRRTADYVDRILKGAKPGELPVEPSTFELAVNLKTAKVIGLRSRARSCSRPTTSSGKERRARRSLRFPEISGSSRLGGP